MLDSQNLEDFWTILRTQWAILSWQNFLEFSLHPLCCSEARQNKIIRPPENVSKADVWIVRASALRQGE